MGYLPPRPVGDSAEAVFHQAVWDAVFGGAFPFIDKPDCLWNRTSQGYYPTIRPARGGKSSAGMIYRGEYDDQAAYAVQDVVVVRAGNPGGFPAGSYVCVKDSPGSTNPPTQPDAGNEYWHSLSDGSTMGVWL